MAKYQQLEHVFGPFIPPRPKLLVLGTFPSVKSRQQQFYYGHPRNQFWRLLADVFLDQVPESLEQKKAFLSRHGVALYDVIESCEIMGSSDASIRNIVPTDIRKIVAEHGIEQIFVNGRKAEQVFYQYQPDLEAIYLPSSSPANAAISYDQKLADWQKKITGQTRFAE